MLNEGRLIVLFDCGQCPAPAIESDWLFAIRDGIGPFAKSTISNTPTGPFQIIVLADSGSLPNLCTVAGPMSRIIRIVGYLCCPTPLGMRSSATLTCYGDSLRPQEGIGNGAYIRSFSNTI